MSWEIAFSIGPVQGYVAQSRRTRDLWGSSYLLAWLTATAAHAAVVAGAEITRPSVTDDPLFGWVSGQQPTPPTFGSFPNQFTARVEEANVDAVVAGAREAFDGAWTRVHEAVWRRFVAPVAALRTREIWDRQVASCWEVTWVAAEGTVRDELARRKHWRTHRLPDEPGDKCTLMADYQEISGHTGAASRHEGEKQRKFWEDLRGRTSDALRDNERLSAPALVKRLFASVAAEAIGAELDVRRWPSTVLMAALPWLRTVNEKAKEEAAAYVTVVKDVEPTALRGTRPLPALAGATPREFFALDANYYHPPFVGGDIGKSLARVNTAVGGPAPVYFALLLADGDHLGNLVRARGSTAVSEGLGRFTRRVRRVVEEHHGTTVYAGGDDVLAMLPVPDALACADALAAAYAAELGATLSAAVVFTHMRAPIGGALARAHDLLDQVAKVENNRDSLVAAVLKSGGETCRWVTCWSRRYPNGVTTRAVGQLDDLVQTIRATPGLSGSLLHHLRDTLSLLTGLSRWKPGHTGSLPEGLDLAKYVRAEVVDSWDGLDTDPADEERLTGLVTDLLGPARGDQGRPGPVDPGRVGLDALQLVQFLSTGGVEEHP